MSYDISEASERDSHNYKFLYAHVGIGKWLRDKGAKSSTSLKKLLLIG